MHLLNNLIRFLGDVVHILKNAHDAEQYCAIININQDKSSDNITLGYWLVRTDDNRRKMFQIVTAPHADPEYKLRDEIHRS